MNFQLQFFHFLLAVYLLTNFIIVLITFKNTFLQFLELYFDIKIILIRNFKFFSQCFLDWVICHKFICWFPLYKKIFLDQALHVLELFDKRIKNFRWFTHFSGVLPGKISVTLHCGFFILQLCGYKFKCFFEWIY